MEALNHFSLASGLVANMEKSSIFLAEVDDVTKNALLEKTGFALGSFPSDIWGFHYLLRSGTNLIARF
ncbi:hypothetical protein KY285_032302 [Solanum tuberosum]|nr:hypothetical protein KY285_032302 [Solanum tuberosum]